MEPYGQLFAEIIKALAMGAIYLTIAAAAGLLVIILIIVYTAKSKKAKENGENIDSPKYTIFRVFIYIAAGFFLLLISPLIIGLAV